MGMHSAEGKCEHWICAVLGVKLEQDRGFVTGLARRMLKVFHLYLVGGGDGCKRTLTARVCWCSGFVAQSHLETPHPALGCDRGECLIPKWISAGEDVQWSFVENTVKGACGFGNELFPPASESKSTPSTV